MAGYAFTNDWFDQTARAIWDQLFAQIPPPRIALEIGSYEGASACYLIERVPGLELHCIDTWLGGVEHTTMAGVRERFDRNTAAALAAQPGTRLIVHQGKSERQLAAFIASHPVPLIDFAYVDGSHQTADVLTDAALTFLTLRAGGLMAFDDYLRPTVKVAVDAFVNCSMQRLRLLPCTPSQVIVQKTAE